MSTWIVYGTLIRVIDGDTVVADLDLGWKVWLRDVRIRLSGINAPELNTDEGKAARDELKQFEGQHINVASHSVDKYGRVLGAVTTDENINLAIHMLSLGMAVPYNP